MFTVDHGCRHGNTMGHNRAATMQESRFSLPSPGQGQVAFSVGFYPDWYSHTTHTSHTQHSHITHTHGMGVSAVYVAYTHTTHTQHSHRGTDGEEGTYGKGRGQLGREGER